MASEICEKVIKVEDSKELQIAEHVQEEDLSYKNVGRNRAHLKYFKTDDHGGFPGCIPHVNARFKMTAVPHYAGIHLEHVHPNVPNTHLHY